MYEQYEYIDADSIYTNNGVLKNKIGIIDFDSLLFFESGAVTIRTKELAINPIKIKFANDLLKIHKYLFGDVYVWAGQTRKVEISKGGKQFLFTHSFPQGFAYIDKLLLELDAASIRAEIAAKLAEILDNINFMHPFREGNGRTQREFIRTLALQKGYNLDLNPLDNQSVYDRYMDATINSKVSEMTELLLELLK